MRIILLFLIVFLNPFFLSGQENEKIKKIKADLLFVKEDSIRFEYYLDLITEYMYFDFTQAEIFANKALELAESMNKENKIIEATIFSGHTQLAKKNYSKALNFYLEAYNLASQTNHSELHAYAANCMTDLYNSLGNNEMALKYSLKSLQILEKIRNKLPASKYKSRKAMILINAGKLHFNLNEIAEAEEKISQAHHILENLGYELQLIEAKLFLGKILYMRNITDSALIYFSNALLLSKKNETKALELEVCFELGNYYFNKNLLDSSLLYFNQNISLANEIGEPPLSFKTYSFLSQIYEIKKDYEQAYHNHKLFKLYSDSVINEKTISQIARIEERVLYEKERKIIAEQDKTENYKLLTILLIIISFLIFFISIYINLRLKVKKKNLEREKLLNDKKNLENDLILKNRELTSKIMYMIKSNSLIEDVINKLLQMKYNLKKENVKPVMDLILSLQMVKDDDLWKEFELRFTNIHADFYDSLSKDFPDLSINEKRLCAYIRLNLNTKEIAYFTATRPNTIEVAKTRLRKKFNLVNASISLSNFLSKY